LCASLFWTFFFFVGFKGLIPFSTSNLWMRTCTHTLKFSHRAKNQNPNARCPYINFWRTSRAPWSNYPCNYFRVVCHENLLSYYLRREQSKQPARCQVVNSKLRAF
jgi:hypothetical protein